MNAHEKENNEDGQIQSRDMSPEYLTIMLGDQMFGIPGLEIRDVLQLPNVTPVPLSPPEVAGFINLRGRVVTVLNIRDRLGLENKRESSRREMSVVVEHEEELYSLSVDSVGDVRAFQKSQYEKVPVTLNTTWQAVSSGIYRLKDQLIVILDVSNLLEEIKADKK